MPTLKTILEKNKEESLYFLEMDLAQKVEELKQAFYSKWSGYKKACEYIERFHKDHIEVILSKLIEYQHAEEVKKDFDCAISEWNVNPIQCDEALLYAYHLILETTACYVLNAFIHRDVCKSIFIQEKIPETIEEKPIDWNKVTDELCKSFREKLHFQLFKNLSERFKYVIHSEISNIKKQIHRFNEEKHRLIEFKNINEASDQIELKDKIHLLFVEKVKYVKYSKIIAAEVDEFKELTDKRTQLIKKNTDLIIECIDKIKKRKYQYPELNLQEIKAFKEKRDHLLLLEKTIDSVMKRNYRDPEQINALKIFNKYFNDLKKENVLYYQKDLGLSKWMFGYNISPLIDQHINLLEEELKNFNVDEVSVRDSLSKWGALRDSLERELANDEKEFQSIVSQKLSDETKQAYYEEIILNKKNDLLIFATRLPEIRSIKNEKFEKWVEELNKAWEQILSYEINLPEVEKYLNDVRTKVALITKNEEEANNVIMAHLFISNKLKKFKNTPKQKVIENRPLVSIVEPIKHDISPIKIPHIKPVKKTPWYHRATDKAWKRALITSFLLLSILAIALTGWGLLLGGTLAIFLATMGGIPGTVAFGGGLFSFSFLCSFGFETKCDHLSASQPINDSPKKLATNKITHITFPKKDSLKNIEKEEPRVKHSKLFTEKNLLTGNENENVLNIQNIRP